MKALKLLYDYDLLEILVDKANLNKFNDEKPRYKNLIFNHILIWEYANYKYSDKTRAYEINKYDLYRNTIVRIIEFNEKIKSSHIGSRDEIIQRLENLNIDKENNILIISQIYCLYNDCESTIIKYINCILLERVYMDTFIL